MLKVQKYSYVLLIVSIASIMSPLLLTTMPCADAYDFTGHYREYNNTNYGAFLEAIGLDAFRRTIAAQLTMEFYVSQSPNLTYTLRTTTAYTDSTYSFQDGMEFEQLREDLGRTVPTIVLVRENRWLSYQYSDPVIKAVREFQGPLVRLILEAGDVQALKLFQKL